MVECLLTTLLQIYCKENFENRLKFRGVTGKSIVAPFSGRGVLSKSHVGFRLVPKSLTLNDLERRIGHYFALFREIR